MSIAFDIYLTVFSLAMYDECKCDAKVGKQITNGGVEWCWLRASPCKLLTGSIAPSGWTWANCVHNNDTQVDCGQVGK